MKYRRVGASGIKVSEIGLGSWLTYGTVAEQEASDACVRQAFESGINFFDTSNAYNRGEGEKAIGAALKPYSRSSYVLSTKVFFAMGEGPNDRGLSRKHIMEQCDASLKRLGTDYIDVYFCHRYDNQTPLEETLRALNDLVSQGKILYAAVSEWSAAQIADAVGITKRLNLHPFISNQPIYNMFERYIEREVMPLSEREGIGQIVFSPLAQGVLTGKYKPGQQPPQDSRAANNAVNGVIKSYFREEVLQCVQELDNIAGQAGITLSQLALAWVLRQPGVSSALIGASRPSQIEENVKAVEVKLLPDMLEAIENSLQKVKDFAPLR
ncbi:MULTISPECIES: aldo/keto reductase family protein [unclassified Paenibacillus]|uniref:aldo/keto reductase family protein n=1 Tax=unclassified Paenibacillus TaxID=185978 RepID=UPI0027821ED4|nr:MULTISPECIES: aldo/keto reductase family protein [unclassified Paenibacillus]MDQ0900995.1 voltage-dependent potassium channel beta subunit [Paenibacillus sp. V4I7]MDQ0920504.1 voltage-dependent potassium channel beta subunit [Paenibacillus sp. V4I5]